MSYTPYKEIPTSKVTGSFTASLVSTRNIDKYRQGVHLRDLAGDKRPPVTMPSQKVTELLEQYPKSAYTDDDSTDTSEPYGFWDSGFIEPLTIRDEVTFSSLDSPFIARSIKAEADVTLEVVEQRVVENDKTNVNRLAFFETGSNVVTTTTSSFFSKGSTGSIDSTRVDEDPNLIKRSAAAGYDAQQVIITGSQRTPGIRAIYKGQDSIAFRGRAPGQAREVFLRSDSIQLNLSGTGINFENGISAAKRGYTQPGSLAEFVSGTSGRYLQKNVRFAYPPISRLNTEWNGIRETTFIDSAPSGTYPVYVRTPIGSSSTASFGAPGSVWENNTRPGHFSPFKEIYGDFITGSYYPDTDEWANTILRFNLTQSSKKFVLLSADARQIDTSVTGGGIQSLANITEGSCSQVKLLVYDFVGSNEAFPPTNDAVTTIHTWPDFDLLESYQGYKLTGPGWFESGDHDQNPFRFINMSHFQLSIDNAGVTSGSAASLVNDTKKLSWFNGSATDTETHVKHFLPERGFKFNFPFVLKRIHIKAEVLAANSGAFFMPTRWGETGADQPLDDAAGAAYTRYPTGHHHIINWTFRPLVSGSGGSTLTANGEQLVYYEGFSGGTNRATSIVTTLVTQSFQAPHATFVIVKTVGSAEQTRGYRKGVGETPNPNFNFRVGRAIYGKSDIVNQIIYSASVGLSSSVVGDGEKNYPKFDYCFTNSELSGTANTAPFYITQSIEIVGDPIYKLNVTQSLSEDASVRANLLPLSSQTNFINKGDTIHFIWSGATLFFPAHRASTIQDFARGWSPIFGVRDMHISLEGYIPQAGKAAVDSLNQNLTSQAIHECTHEIIHDQYETFVSATYTGSMLSRIANPNTWQQGGVNFALHGYKIFDEAERFYDTGIIVGTGSAELGLIAGDRFFVDRPIGQDNLIFSASTLGSEPRSLVGGLKLIFDFNEYIRTHIAGKNKLKYGVMSTQSIKNSAIYRSNHYGQFRDMLEQRKYGRFIGTRKEDRLSEAKDVNTSAVFLTSSTTDLEWNEFLTSSFTYKDRSFINVLSKSTQGQTKLRPEGAPYKS